MKTQLNHIFIVSAALASLTPEENKRRHEQAKLYLDTYGLSFSEAKGVYEGVEEPSLVVVTPFDKLPRAENAVKHLCKTFTQVAYLYSDNERVTTLHEPSGRLFAKLGILRAAPDASNNYTEINGEKYACSV